MTPHTTIIVLGALLEQCMRDADLDLITIRAEDDAILLNKHLPVYPQPPVTIPPGHYIDAIRIVAGLIGESPTWDELRRCLTARIRQPYTNYCHD